MMRASRIWMGPYRRWSAADRVEEARRRAIAVATWSTEWNYGPGWEGTLLAAYGVDPDPERIAYYRLLWDLGP